MSQLSLGRDVVTARALHREAHRQDERIVRRDPCEGIQRRLRLVVAPLAHLGERRVDERPDPRAQTHGANRERLRFLIAAPLGQHPGQIVQGDDVVRVQLEHGTIGRDGLTPVVVRPVVVLVVAAHGEIAFDLR